MFRVFLLIFLFFSACGYKTIDEYKGNISSKSFFIQNIVFAKYPQNSIYIENALYEALNYKFGMILADNKNKSDIFIRTKLLDIKFSALEYDSKGYVIRKRVNVLINFNIKEDFLVKTYNIEAINDFAVDPNPNINDVLMMKAVNGAIDKIIDSFCVKLIYSEFSI